jgi:hypothetical protein
MFEQGMSPTRSEAFNQLNSQTINSYNSLYLTTRKGIDDIFTFRQISTDLNTITTPIKVDSVTGIKYLKFLPNSFDLVDEEDADNGSTRFQIVLDTYKLAYIRHLKNNIEYRLCLENDGTIYFTTSSVSQQYSLGYLVDSDGYLVLYNVDAPPYKIVRYNGTTLIQSPLSAGETIKSTDSLLKIDYSITPLSYDINSSWVSYDNSNPNLAEINDLKSVYGLDNQYLLTTTYNDIADGIDLNFINLKTNISENDIVKRGSSINSGSDNIPKVDFRFYTSINSGNSQEKGNENIVLTYVFYDKDISILPGTDTYFTTPSSIYPYEKLNINDTNFVINGAYGSFTPAVSDKIKKLRTNTSSFNNGRYLCTWLSGNGLGDNYMWVDRYYYPDIITKEAAYTAEMFTPSFDDPIDGVVYSQIYKQQISKKPIFDKKSDLFLEPSTQYIYQRVSESDFAQYFDSLSSSLIFYNKDQMSLNGKTTTNVDVSKINETKAYTITFDVYLKKNASIGYSLLGNLANFGFSILNDTFITPIITTMQDSTVFYYNTDSRLIAKQQFDKPVKDIIRFEGLDDYIVVCDDGYVYNLTYSNVVTKLNIIPYLSAYTSYTPFENKVAFVLDNSNCLVVDSMTLAYSFSAVTNTSEQSISGAFYLAPALYGVPGVNVKMYDSNHVCYLRDNTIYKQNVNTNVIYSVIKSVSGLNDYAIDSLGNYLVAHDTNRLSLFNKNRKFVLNYSLSSIPLTANKCEFIRQFRNGVEQTYFSVIGMDQDQKTSFNIFTYDGVLSSTSTLLGNLSSTQTNYTNYNYYLNNRYKNVLKFKIRLYNPDNKYDIYTNTITYDYSNIAEGYINFGYVFDSVKGVVKLLVNGLPVEIVNFDPAKYAINDIFNDNITIGGTGFYNGMSLADYLKQKNMYVASDARLRNIAILNKPLQEREISTLSLIGRKIDPIYLSIPCGQRNNIEEIVRYFKFGVPDSYSNHIKVEIKNSGISDTDLQTTLKTRILNNINNTIKGDVIIDDVIFSEYNQ